MPKGHAFPFLEQILYISAKCWVVNSHAPCGAHGALHTVRHCMACHAMYMFTLPWVALYGQVTGIAAPELMQALLSRPLQSRHARHQKALQGPKTLPQPPKPSCWGPAGPQNPPPTPKTFFLGPCRAPKPWEFFQLLGPGLLYRCLNDCFHSALSLSSISSLYNASPTKQAITIIN